VHAQLHVCVHTFYEARHRYLKQKIVALKADDSEIAELKIMDESDKTN
jgi:hypothetical protein